MFKVSATLLSVIILIQSFNFDLKDLPKLVVLADHIASHIEEGENFSDFISQHYGSEQNEHNEKHQEHEDLPFKHQHADSHFHIVYIICNNVFAIKNDISIESLKNFTYKEPITSLLTNTIFQPPRVV